ncbi:MAG: trigger factor family protein [Clostridia bacterium]|nr:trigger factor family protein [Clostridia bacterium]
MNYTFEASEKSTVKLVINFTGEEWKSAIDQAYLRTRGKYAVPGFRKGKCPKPVIENYYGKAVFFDDAFNVLYSEHYPAIIEKESANFTAVGAPELSVDELTDEKVVLTAIVPVKPEVKIGSYKGLEIKKYEYNVTEE